MPAQKCKLSPRSQGVPWHRGDRENERLLQTLGRVEGIVLPLHHFHRRSTGWFTRLMQMKTESRFLVVMNKELGWPHRYCDLWPGNSSLPLNVYRLYRVLHKLLHLHFPQHPWLSTWGGNHNTNYYQVSQNDPWKSDADWWQLQCLRIFSSISCFIMSTHRIWICLLGTWHTPVSQIIETIEASMRWKRSFFFTLWIFIAQSF